jgi:DNA-binding IclR family transcriptional regulator
MVLIHLAANPDSTVRQLSDTLDITERQIARLIREMVESGVISVVRVGQRNSYSIDRGVLLSHPAFASRPLGEVIDILVAAGLTIRKPE